MSAAESPGARALSGDSGALRALAGTWAAAGERLRAGEPARRAQLAFDAGGRGQVVRALGHGAAVLGGQSGRLGATLADAGNALRDYAEATEELRDSARSLERRRQLAASTAGSREPAEPFGTGAAVAGNPGAPGDDGAAGRASRGLIVCDERRDALDRRVAARLRELSARLRRLSEAGPRSGGNRGADGTGDGAETARALAALTALCRVEQPGGRLRLRALPGQAVSAAVRSGGPGEGFGVLAVRLLEFGRALGRVASAAVGSVLLSAALTLQSAFLVAGRHASGVPGLPGRAVMFALVSGLGIRQGGPRVAVGAFALLELDIGRLAAAGRLPRTVQGLIIGGRLLGGFRDAELRVLPEGRGAGPGGEIRGDPAAEDRAREYRRRASAALGPGAAAAVDGPVGSLRDLFVRGGALDVLGGKRRAVLEVLRHAGDPPRLTVILPSTQEWSPWDSSVPNDLYGNLVAMQGRPGGLERFAEQAITAELSRLPAAERARAEIQIVGFSQGGLAAAALASRGTLPVTRVITAGAPIGVIAESLPEEVRVLAYEAPDDPVPKLDGRANPEIPQVVTVSPGLRETIGRGGPTGPGDGAHSPLRYAALAEASALPEEIRTGVLRDLADVTGSRRYTAEWVR